MQHLHVIWSAGRTWELFLSRPRRNKGHSPLCYAGGRCCSNPVLLGATEVLRHSQDPQGAVCWLSSRGLTQHSSLVQALSSSLAPLLRAVFRLYLSKRMPSTALSSKLGSSFPNSCSACGHFRCRRCWWFLVSPMTGLKGDNAGSRLPSLGTPLHPLRTGDALPSILSPSSCPSLPCPQGEGIWQSAASPPALLCTATPLQNL